MECKIIFRFLKKYFPNIEGVLLFGSYINNPVNANDIDLLLISNNFLYSSQESFFFEEIKINTIKFNESEMFNILAKHYQQGDFYRLVFINGVILLDKNKTLKFIRNYVTNCYPKGDNNIIALGLNETLFKLAEYQDVLKKKLLDIEYFIITSKIVFHLMDWFLLSNGVHNVKIENKYKGSFFSKHFPVENELLVALFSLIPDNEPKKFLLKFHSITKSYDIPYVNKYSNDLIFDDYTQSRLILFIESLLGFEELKSIMNIIESKNNFLKFYVYQVDEGNHEKTGCYFVFDNSTLEIEKNKKDWLFFFKENFSNYQYIFPYNNIYVYPEIKFVGKENEKLINDFLMNCTIGLLRNNFRKESFFIYFLQSYVSKGQLKMEDIYNFNLGRLNAKTRSSNYLTSKSKETEQYFLNANVENKKKLIEILKTTNKIDLDLSFPKIQNAPIWFHFQVIDRMISPLFKNDFEKLFYIHCLMKLNE
ncbi:MAG: hypothetical protein ABI793_15445 [Flavobacterium sp.]